MKFSVFTPTNNIKYLDEVYACLKAQTFSDWEWIVLVNQGADYCNFDGRVIVCKASYHAHGVGALKAEACGYCSGDYLVELDHDDLLVPTALEEIAIAIDAPARIDPPDFLYSDCVEFQPHGGSHVYDKKFGWEHEDVWLRIGEENPQHRYTINKSFPLNASTLSQIFYAPNHVRVWRREFYEAIGGHDPRLTVCDDFDLVCRSYLQGTFAYVDKPLYLYRIREDGANTWLKHNAEIQVKQAELGDRYRRALIQRWCQNEGLEMLDLGGGANPQPGFENVDLLGNVDVFDRLRMQPDNSVGCIRTHDFLEHIPHCADSTCFHSFTRCVVELMNEIYRVLVPGGWLISATPSTDGRGAFQDPTHCSFWNENSWMYYCRAEQQKFVPGIKARFQATRVYTDFPNQWCRDKNIPYVYADVVALKGQRQPGVCEI